MRRSRRVLNTRKKPTSRNQRTRPNIRVRALKLIAKKRSPVAVSSVRRRRAFVEAVIHLRRPAKPKNTSPREGLEPQRRLAAGSLRGKLKRRLVYLKKSDRLSRASISRQT